MRGRDRLVAGAAVVVVLGLALGVVALVRDAEQSGIRTRQRLRLEQTRQLASSMDTRVQAAFGALTAAVGAPGAWVLEPGDAADAERLQPQNPSATTGSVLVGVDGTVLNGSLLRDPTVVGRRLDRPGLEPVLEGQPALLPVDEGLTTAGPTIAVGIPLRDAQGVLAGAHLTEVEVSADSAFNLEVAELVVEGGSFSFVDQRDRVVASSDVQLLGERLTGEERGLAPGFHDIGDTVAAVAEVPSAGWRLLFLQSEAAFQGDITTPLRRALLLLLATGAAFATIAAILLVRRLAAAREEQRRLAEIAQAREEFTSIVSHELRTPVAGLLGFLQTTVDHWDVMPDDERRRAVGRAFANARSLQTLTSDVLDTASIEAQTLAYRFEEVELRELVESTVGSVRDGTPDRPVNVDRPDEPVWVRADPIRLSQVLTNLLDNAGRSAPAGTAVDVRIARSDGEVQVRVRDHGPGIADDERERIFEKFTRGRAGGGGTGLGLYISRSIVEAHGGRIWVEADGRPGATIVFTLPASAPPAGAGA